MGRQKIHRLRGQRALVTGGSSGIGLAVATALIRAGAHVVVAASRREPLEAALAGLRTASSFPDQRVAHVVMDVADPGAVARGVADAIDALGGLDLLINNAGVALARRFLDTDPVDFERILSINTLGTIHVTRAALPTLVAQRSGTIVNVSSVAGLLGVYGYTAYAASKFAVTGFSEALRQELRRHGIRVCVVFPPDTDTPQLAEENRTKPAETRAVAGGAGLLSAEHVADQLLAGALQGRAHIVPGADARLTVLAARWAPGLVRRIIDRRIARATAESTATPD